MNLNQLWYRKNTLATLLWPFSLVYRLVIALRRMCYRYKLFSSYKSPLPVIVVGNISVGGVGKTPLVAEIVNRLQHAGLRPGIVSRGYGAQTEVFPQHVTVKSDPRLVGDEPYLLAMKTGCSVVIDPNRVQAAKTLLADTDCNVIVSDDGLQHYALQRDVEIAVVDGARGCGNGFCLPAGPLREPVSRLREVNCVVVNGSEEQAERLFAQRKMTNDVLRTTSDKKPQTLSMQLTPGALYSIADPNLTLAIDALKNQTVHAVAGIGHPERFFQTLEALGLQIVRHPFPDHHLFHRSDIAFEDDAMVIMTEKDAVKCRAFVDARHWCLAVSVSAPDAFFEVLISL